MTLEKLKDKYGNIKWSDLSSPYCPKIYTDFCRDFKKYLKKSFNVYEITGFKANHFDTDGYICNPLTNKNIKNIYLFGSKVYKTDNENSDFDYIVVCNKKEQEQIVLENINISFFEIEEWEYFAKENDVKFIECIFLDKEFKIKETYIPKFEINKEKLHSSFSRVASNSFVKMKKKLTVDKDYNPYIAKNHYFTHYVY